MVTKSGQFKTKLPTQYRTLKSSKKVLKKEGEKHNYSIIKCTICGKQKMEKYDLMDKETNTITTTIRECKNCKFINASSVFYNPVQATESQHPITYFKPSGSLEDKSSQ